jgi:hypothetical protein
MLVGEVIPTNGMTAKVAASITWGHAAVGRSFTVLL